MADPEEPTETPADAELLDAIAELWDELDPPPDDLAEGVLARIETNDLDAELLTLVEWDKELSGVRSVTMLRAPEEVGTWSLEYLGPGFRVQVRISRSARQARLDGWVVPAQPMTVFLTSMGKKPTTDETRVGESGRFEFPVTPTGACRLTFVSEPVSDQASGPGSARPLVTPPFWI
ncbi:hypothetical protein ABIE44_002917 [Marmoricola sp. OAE513]|uniref:hypothetical protein n=1 Tax=Marmoricola sp. OAE513 TaxID=2817894 RepID=UPI001AE9FEF9